MGWCTRRDALLVNLSKKKTLENMKILDCFKVMIKYNIIQPFVLIIYEYVLTMHEKQNTFNDS